MRVLGLALLAGLGIAVSGCSGTSSRAASATALATTPSAGITLTVVSGAVSLSLQISDVSCVSQQDGAAGWEISGQGISTTSGQTEPWSLTEFPNVNPAELRLALPDGMQYDSDAEGIGVPTEVSMSASSISLDAVPLYTNGDASADKVTVTGRVLCTAR